MRRIEQEAAEARALEERKKYEEMRRIEQEAAEAVPSKSARSSRR